MSRRDGFQPVHRKRNARQALAGHLCPVDNVVLPVCTLDSRRCDALDVASECRFSDCETESLLAAEDFRDDLVLLGLGAVAKYGLCKEGERMLDMRSASAGRRLAYRKANNESCGGEG